MSEKKLAVFQCLGEMCVFDIHSDDYSIGMGLQYSWSVHIGNKAKSPGLVERLLEIGMEFLL